MQVVEIPGGTASLRERHELRMRQRRLIEAAGIVALPALRKLPEEVKEGKKDAATIAAAQVELTREEIQSLFDLQNATIVATLASWTLDLEVPTIDTVEDLNPELYEALSNATKKLGREVAQKTNFQASDPKGGEFTDSPTPPSADSGNGSKGDTESGSTETSQTSGTSISSDASSTE